MLTGDEDISMELFLFQMGIFVGPYILGKMGYGFELNTSTLILFINWITIAVRFCFRQAHPDASIWLLLVDDTQKLYNETRESEQEAAAFLPVRMALGMDTGDVRCNVGTMCYIRACMFGMSLPKAGDGTERRHCCRKAGEDHDEIAARIHQEIHEVACGIRENDTSAQNQEDANQADTHVEGELHEGRPFAPSLITLDEYQQLVLKLFRRYDFDGSGTVNSSDELSQLTTNLSFQISQDPYNVTTIDVFALEEACRSCGADVNMDIKAFEHWFADAILNRKLPT
jgi:hypothetical protein